MKRYFFILCFTSAVYGQAYADTIKASSAITAVTVFQDRAIVTRSAPVHLQSGSHELELDNLPMGLMEDSVRVSGKGPARITGFEIKKTFLKRTEDARLRVLEDELEKLREQDNAIKGTIKNLLSQKNFLESIKIKASDDITKDINIARVKIQEWQEILRFYLDNLTKIARDIIEQEVKARETAERIKALEKEINQLKSVQPEGQRSAIIGIEANKAGTLEIALSYTILNAGWQPSYDARATNDSSKIEIMYYGEVRQKTGEEWKNAEITLSTARPAIGAQAPELPPWHIGGIMPLKRERKGEGILMEKALVAPQAAAEPEEEIAAPLTADISEGWTASTFRIRKKTDIPSDGAPHKVTISVEKPDAVFEYETVPKLSGYAYLRGEVKNTTDYPLLAGRVNVFVSDNFIGRSNIKTIAPSESFKLYLGIDEGIKVRRELLKHERGKSGFISNKLRATWKFKLEVTNFKKDKVRITAVDQIPVSQDSNITVKLVETSVEPKEKTEQGILKWMLELNPGEKKEIVFEFYVDYPADMPVFIP